VIWRQKYLNIIQKNSNAINNNPIKYDDTKKKISSDKKNLKSYLNSNMQRK